MNCEPRRERVTRCSISHEQRVLGLPWRRCRSGYGANCLIKKNRAAPVALEFVKLVRLPPEGIGPVKYVNGTDRLVVERIW